MADPSKNSVHFDTDLRERLDRLYSSAGTSSLDRARMAMPLTRRSQSAKALQEALAELRNRREQAQGTMRLQEEIDYLRDQIALLRSLGNEIDRLRRQFTIKR
ncbi:hypothetical protein GWK36_06220 [Caldichromatium japonicum]|uniref:Uncharacterized protein n=1 Tax=Caldichromatium japonicum TaxID=2699430 RepID=A0A6G7VCF1_9GAMM|nr:hypothetical protein [Caldichromatium japonicum]QIK37644.1 hypothetical protein GWK36_06220 [Caldichromatium japonicum]